MKNEILQNINDTSHLLQSINTIDSFEFSAWTKEKANLRYNGKMPTFPIYNNFIYWCNLGINIGSEQNKLRPAIILKTSQKSSICSIIPLTSKRLHDMFWFHIDLEKIDSTALIEQIRTISKLRILNPFRKQGKLITISQTDWNNINSQLNILYRLRPLKEV